MVIDNGNATWTGEVIHAENLGSDNYLFVDIGAGEPILVRQEGKAAIPWATTSASVRSQENLHRFDAQGTRCVSRSRPLSSTGWTDAARMRPAASDLYPVRARPPLT